MYKAEVIHKSGPWRSLDQVEFATAKWVHWWNQKRLHSAVGDVPRILPEGSRSALVPPADPTALARVLQGLLADPERRRREGAANRVHCAAHYELRACLERWLLLYRAAAVAR